MTALSNPLIECQQLLAQLEQPKLIILDASIPPVGSMAKPQFSWPTTVIGNAKRCDINAGFSDHHALFPHTRLSASAFQQQARSIGINHDSTIVVYDDLGLFSAARVWWMFKAMGHHNVHILNGGLPEWLRLGLPTQHANSDEAAMNTGNFVAQENPQFFCDTEEVLEAIANKDVEVLDARAAERFAGQAEEPRPGVRKGHIPNSLNMPFGQLLCEGKVRPVNELKALFAQLVERDKTLVMSCGSGVTACILALGAHLCGFDDIRVYDGSWGEWGARAELPIETSSE